MEPLLRVDTSLEGCRPGGSVNSGTLLVALDRDPVDKQGDGVLGLGVAAERRTNAGRGGSGDLDGDVLALDEPGVLMRAK